jgi:hypothetical protein
MMRRLAAGIYCDETSIHFHVREMCDELNVAYTRENIRAVEQAALRAFAQVFGAPPKEVLIVEVPPEGKVN